MRENTAAEIIISSQGNVAVLSATGELDFAICESLRETFQKLEKDNKHIVLDLRETSYLDSEGIKVIVECSKDVMKKEGKVAMVCGKAPQRVMSLSGMDTLFPICPDLETAIRQVTTSS